MVYFFNVIGGIVKKLKLRRYIRAKDISKQLHKNERPVISFVDKLYYLWANYVKCGCIRAAFRNHLDNKFLLWIATLYYTIWTEGTFLNYIVKSILGFLGGVFLVYAVYIFLAIPMNFHIFSSTYMAVIVILILPIGLAFSITVRCIVLSVIPQLCTRQGRNALVAYSFILLLTGPTRNTVYNTAMFSEMLSCTQEQLKSAAKNITEVVMKPFRTLRSTLVDIMKTIRIVISRVKDGLIFIKDKIVALMRTIMRAAEWLVSSNNICNEKVNTPFVRCITAFLEAREVCKQKVSPILYWMCDIGSMAAHVCEHGKIFDFYCDFETYLKDNVITVIKDNLRDFVRFIKTLFYVSIGFHHSYMFETNQSTTLRQIAKEVVHDIENRLSFFFFLFDTFTLILSTYLFYVILKTLVYWYLFLNHDWYDNRYINKYFIQLDIIRSASQRSTVLPLTPSERRLYVSMGSLRLTVYEKKLLFSDFGFMLKSTLQIVFHFFLDISVYWILTVIQKYGRIAYHMKSNTIDLVPTGIGFLSDIFRLIYKLVKPMIMDLHFDSYACLPHPIPPDFVRYHQICVIIFIAWVMVFLEPYGLRFRNYIMTYYNEEAGRRRAGWLYNNIQMGRVSLLTYARKQMNKRASFGVRDNSTTIGRWFVIRFKWLWYFCPYKQYEDNCIVCNGLKTAEIKCTTPECYASYCQKCFEDANSKCTLCRISTNLEAEDISEESASDDDDDDDGDDDDEDEDDDNEEDAETSEESNSVVSMRSENANENLILNTYGEQDLVNCSDNSIYYSPAYSSNTDSSDTSTAYYTAKKNTTGSSENYFTPNTSICESSERTSFCIDCNTDDQKKYFRRTRNKIDWAFIEDFNTPMPDLQTWIQTP